MKIAKQTPPAVARPATSPAKVADPRDRLVNVKNMLLEATGAWDRIVPVSAHAVEWLRMNVYGLPGTGKTTFACTFPKPLLLLGCEDGTRSVRGVPGVDFALINESGDIDEYVAGLKARKASRCMPGKPYATVVVDTITSLQDIVLKELMGWDKTAVQLKRPAKKGDDDPRIVPRRVYMDRASKIKELLRTLMDPTPGFVVPAHVILLAQQKDHSRKFDDADEDGGGAAKSGFTDDELITPFIAASIGQSACEYLSWQCDWICQTFVRERKVKTVSKSTVNGVTTEKEKMVGTGQPEFCLRTSCSHPIYAAKVRKDKALKMADVMVDPSYDKIKAMVGSL